MNYTEYTDSPLGQLLVVIAAIFAVLFTILLILLPFYVQSMNTWMRKSYKEQVKIRKLMEQQTYQEDE